MSRQSIRPSVGKQGGPKKLTVEQVAESVRLYDGGDSLAKIAARFNVSRQAIWDLLRRRTTMRPQKRYGPDNHFHRGGELADDNAQNVLENAIARGDVKQRYICEQCGDSGTMRDGRSKVQAHHCDYNKPLEVMWLCQKCHHEWHKHNKAIEKAAST